MRYELKKQFGGWAIYDSTNHCYYKLPPQIKWYEARKQLSDFKLKQANGSLLRTGWINLKILGIGNKKILLHKKGTLPRKFQRRPII